MKKLVLILSFVTFLLPLTVVAGDFPGAFAGGAIGGMAGGAIGATVARPHYKNTRSAANAALDMAYRLNERVARLESELRRLMDENRRLEDRVRDLERK